MTQISIIGAGKVGTSLGCALSRKGYQITALSCQRFSSARESQRIIGQGIPFDANLPAARLGQWIILSVPDDQIEKTAFELADSLTEWRGKFIFHCSGLHSSVLLIPLQKRGALTASIHPVQSFPQIMTAPDALKDTYFGLEGSAEALELAKKIVYQLGARSIILEAKNKPLYHIACSMASNFFVALLDTAVSLLKHNGVDKEQAGKVLLPLVQGTLQNVKKFSTRDALTGPAVRGDETSLKIHLQALRQFPEYYELYLKITSQILHIAEKEKKLTPQKINMLRALLEGK